jgi:hypothetical protein
MFLPRTSLGIGSAFRSSDLNDFGEVAGQRIVIDCGNSKGHQRCVCERAPYWAARGYTMKRTCSLTNLALYSTPT